MVFVREDRKSILIKDGKGEETGREGDKSYSAYVFCPPEVWMEMERFSMKLSKFLPGANWSKNNV